MKILRDRVYSEWFWAYMFLGVDIAWSIVFLFYPILRAFLYSFQNFTLENVGNPQFIGLANYIKILKDTTGWWYSIKISVLYTLGVVPVGVLLPLGLALLINPLDKKSQNFFKAAFYLPGVVSGVVVALVLRWIFYPEVGLINWVLVKFGGHPQTWYANPDLALFTLILMSWISSHGWGIILYSAALSRIPKSIYEAADIDAASSWTRFWKITWPLLKPVTLYVVIISIINSLQNFWGAFFITRGGPMRATEFVNWRIYTTFYMDGNYSLASAQAVILMLIIAILSVINFKFFGKGVEY